VSRQSGGLITGTTRAFQLLLILTGLFVVAFLATAPWSVYGRDFGRLTIALGPLTVLVIVGFFVPSWREYLRNLSEVPVSRRSWFWLITSIGLVLTTRIVFSQYNSLQVNAWDFSVFELAIGRTPSAGFLYSHVEKRPFLATHASYILALFVPLYRLVPTHLWLLLAHALAVALATGVGFLLFEDILGDRSAGALLAIGYLLNSYTAKTVEYPFHVEVFYPLGIFGIVLSARRKRWLLTALATLLTVSTKEDAIVPVVGIAAALFLEDRGQWRVSLALLGAALTVFAISSYVVMPGNSGSPIGVAWYSDMWSDYGRSPLAAAAGMALRPLRVARDLSHSGIRHILEPLLFTPILGGPWLFASVPGLLVYGVAGHGKANVAQFALYYSAPILPLLTISAAAGVRRVASIGAASKRVALVRIGVALVCLMCALDGPGYVARRPAPQRLDLAPLLRNACEPIRIQGSLFPHAPLSTKALPLADLTARPGTVILDLSSNPYPSSSVDLETLVRECRRDAECRVDRGGGLVRLSRCPEPAR